MADIFNTRPAQTYTYQPISSKRVIRVAELKAGEYGTPLTVALGETQLFVTKIAKQANPKYETLSYEWGQEKRDRPITCDGRTLLITNNLEKALQRLRVSDQPLRIWIDSLCINQDDLHERNDQVAMMPLIYKSASKVNMWLGEENATTVEGLSMLDKLAKLYDCLESKLQTKEEPLHWLNQISSVNALRKILGDSMAIDVEDKEPWNSLGDIMNRTYFERTWITQEILLSWNATVIIGAHRLSWHELRKAALVSTKCDCLPIDRSSLSHFRLSMIAEADRLRWKGRRFSVETLLSVFHMSRCRDPRDIVFSIPQMAKYPYGAISSNVPVDIGLPPPDYSKPVELVYQETTAMLITQKQDLSILFNVQLPSMRNLSSMPTWVIDWSPSPEGWWSTYQSVNEPRPVKSQMAMTFKKNLLLPPVPHSSRPIFPVSISQPISISGRVLTAKALSLGDITWTSEGLWQHGLIPKLARVFTAFEARYENTFFDKYVNGEPMLQVLARTLLMNRNDAEAEARAFETTGPGGWTPMFESFFGVIVTNTMLEHPDKPNIPTELFYTICLEKTGAGLYLAAAKHINNQKLFFTDTIDLIGMAALDVQIGDRVVLLEGSYAPVLLRKAKRQVNDDDKSDWRWEIVCEAYVHAAMSRDERIYGEELLVGWEQYEIV